jgi:hypothetical protein
MTASRCCEVVLGFCIAFAILTGSAARSDNAVVGEPQKVDEFARLSADLGRSLERSATWKGLSQVRDFDRLANLTKDDIDLCVNYIADPTRTRFERYVAGYSAYKLDPSAYVAFIRRLLALRARGLVPTGEIITIITPPLNGVPDVIYDNYDRPDVQDLIKTLLALPDLDDWARKWLIFESDHGGCFNRLSDRLHGVWRKLTR